MTDRGDIRSDADTRRLGLPLESALAPRERAARSTDHAFGEERVFPELVEALLEEVPYSDRLLEVGAAGGLLTVPLLGKTGSLTALEPYDALYSRLLDIRATVGERLTPVLGMVEDLDPTERFDNAVVTFTVRRGIGLITLLKRLVPLVRDRIVVVFDDDGSMDWAYLARTAAVQGFDTRLRIVTDHVHEEPEQRRAVILIAGVSSWCEACAADEIWDIEARVVDVPFPAPRGAATRLVRYFLAGADHAILAKTDREGVERLYGNLRTAAHRLARDEITVRRTDEGVQLVRLPKPAE